MFFLILKKTEQWTLQTVNSLSSFLSFNSSFFLILFFISFLSSLPQGSRMTGKQKSQYSLDMLTFSSHMSSISVIEQIHKSVRPGVRLN